MKSKDRSSRGTQAPRICLHRRFLNPLTSSLHLTLLAGLLFFLPLDPARAIWVPDENGNPAWTPLAGEPATPSDSPSTSDSNGNGLADWLDAFNIASASGLVSFWSGGTFIVNGVSTTYGGVWHATSPDTDGDLIPDDLDPCPSDSTNNSFYWTGGTFVINNISHAFRAGWYAGSSSDQDADGLPDSLSDWFTNPSAHGTLQSWEGGTFTISGQPSTFAPVSYYASQYVDSDGDGIPDELDPYPSDPWNNTEFTWPGGDFPINGVMTHFPPVGYGGAWTDTDGDGIPDQADPLPADAANNSTWWQGGSFQINGSWQTYPAQWHRADAADSDGDGIPDDIDPMPYDSSNWQTFDWAGGWFWVNSQYCYLSPGTFYGPGTDSDGDGIPDAVDPYPYDLNNGNVTNQYTWAGGTYLIDNQYQTLGGGTFGGSWTDTDGDGIPDPADPYPGDPNNNSSQFYWAGGWFDFNNQSTYFSPAYYAGYAVDSDGDGVPDVCDLYPYDASNGNITYSWAGGTFRISDSDVTISGGTFAGSWVDSDGDGIPDPQDPYPYDSNNNNNTSGSTAYFYWSGGTFRLDNADVTFQATNYTGTWADSDGDGIPDSLDPHPYDSGNGNTTFYWAGGGFMVANNYTYFAAGTYNGAWADSDGDGIPDSLDAYPYDSSNGNTTFYWAGGTFRVDNQDQTFGAAYYGGMWSDTDGDGIPDCLDIHPYDASNGNNRFSWNGGYFVIDNQGVTFAGGDYDGAWEDNDGDGIPDSLDPYPYDATNGNTVNDTFYWEGGSFYVDGVEATWAPGDYPGSWADSDGDGIPDSLDVHPWDYSNNSTMWPGGTFTIDGFAVTLPPQWHRTSSPDTDGDGIPDDLDPYPFDSTNNPGFDWPSAATDFVINNQAVTFQPTHYGMNWQDTDGDGIPDVADPWPLDRYNKNDSDGDGIPDSVETAYASLLDMNNPADASNLRQDGLTYLQAYQYNPSLPLDQLVDSTVDTDHDGIPDLVELQHGLNPFTAVDAAASKMGDFVSNLEKYQLGLNLDATISEQEYESVTGQSWDQFLVNHNQQLADAEDDSDGDGVSNIDELLVFHTNPRDFTSRPDDSQIILAIFKNLVSTTTLIHYNSLVAGLTDDPGSGGGDSGSGGGDSGSGGGDNTGTGNGGDSSNGGDGSGGDGSGDGSSGGDTGSGGDGSGGAGDGGSNTGGDGGGSGSNPSGPVPPLSTDDYDQECVSTTEITTTTSVVKDDWVMQGGLTPSWLNGVVTPYILWARSVHTGYQRCKVTLWRWKAKGETSWNTTIPYVLGEPTDTENWTETTTNYAILGPGETPSAD